MFGNHELAEAHAVITEAHRWVNKDSPVQHEFLVVDAETAGGKFWVRIDRSRNDRGGPTMRWDALDTVNEFFWGLMRTRSDFIHSR